MEKLKIAIFFGTKSSENEVSIVTASQVVKWIDKNKYELFLIYIDHDNQAYLCPNPNKIHLTDFIKKTINQKKLVKFVNKGISFPGILSEKKVIIDVAVLATHGGTGEKGQLQGLLDYYDIPYTCSGVFGSALGMDKVRSKILFKSLGYSTSPFVWFNKEDFETNPKKILKETEELKLPLFVKPASCGSSIGVSEVNKESELLGAIKHAGTFDQEIIVEEKIKGSVDINCAVIGGNNPEATVCEQPISDGNFLTFEEKYLKGGKTKGMAGLSRIVPAPIPENISHEIQNMAKMIFKAFNCWGIARIDFLYQKGLKKIYINEINTIPGSLAFYLFEEIGITPSQLIDKLINLAIEKNKKEHAISYLFDSKILDQK